MFVRDCGNKLGITSQFLRLVVRPRDDVAKLYHGLRSYLPSYLPTQQLQQGQHAQHAELGSPTSAAALAGQVEGAANVVSLAGWAAATGHTWPYHAGHPAGGALHGYR